MSLKEFEFHNKLGEGAFSTVFKVTRKADDQTYALKQVKLSGLSKKEKENALNEIRILASFDHPNIISFKQAFLDDNMSVLCIVMDFAEAGDLLKLISTHQKSKSKIPEQLIWQILKHSAAALSCLHANKILHRDVKSANIFMGKDNKALLGDLNVSKVAKQGLAYTQTGTPYYASPEVWKDQPYNTASDIWSLGCVIYELAALNPPFNGRDMNSLCRSIIRGIFPDIPHISKNLMKTIRMMLQVNPGARPKASELAEVNCEKFYQIQVPENSQLLKTIVFDNKVATLRSRLPESQYKRKMSADSFKENLPVIEEGEEKVVKVEGNEKVVGRLPRIPLGKVVLPKVPQKARYSPARNYYEKAEGYQGDEQSPVVVRRKAPPMPNNPVSNSCEGSNLRRIGSLVIDHRIRHPASIERVQSLESIDQGYKPQPSWWG